MPCPCDSSTSTSLTTTRRPSFVSTPSAIATRTGSAALKMVQDHRWQMRDQFGVKLDNELHATDLVAGRGRQAVASRRDPSKYQRSLIFKNTLNTVASHPHSTLINVCLEYAGRLDAELDAWDRLFNRIDCRVDTLENTRLAWCGTGPRRRLRQRRFVTSGAPAPAVRRSDSKRARPCPDHATIGRYSDA